jgi:L-arabinose isomerase
VLTAIAMLIAKVVSGSALYHELEAMDHTTGELVIANTGEHDLTLTCGSRRPRLRKNVWYCDSDARCGYCAVAEIEPGPMTLIATVLDPQGQMRVVTAEGAVTDRAFPRTGTMNGAFRFATGPPEAAWIAWATTGVGHHSAVAKGHQGDAVAAMSRHLGLRHTAI